jgi:hypothetical protein
MNDLLFYFCLNEVLIPPYITLFTRSKILTFPFVRASTTYSAAPCRYIPTYLACPYLDPLTYVTMNLICVLYLCRWMHLKRPSRNWSQINRWKEFSGNFRCAFAWTDLVGGWAHLLVVVVDSCLAKDKYRFLRLGYNRRVACHKNADRNSIGRTHRTREADCHPNLGGGREVLYVVLCTYLSLATTTTTCSCFLITQYICMIRILADFIFKYVCMIYETVCMKIVSLKNE